jgi:hypothetical protein
MRAEFLNNFVIDNLRIRDDLNSFPKNKDDKTGSDHHPISFNLKRPEINP